MFLRSVVLISLLFVSVCAAPLHAAEHYVSPTGAGDGSRAQPWNLATAFNHPPSLQPGDTIWLRGGTYGNGRSTIFKCNLQGTQQKPIIVRQYPGERAIINGGIENGARCTWVWWWGFEITNTSPDRKVQESQRPGGINLRTRGHKLINLVIHNTGHPAIGFWNDIGDGGEIYGTIIFGTGLYDLSDRRFPEGWTRGNGIYAQNQDGTRLISDVISFRNFTDGMKVYTEGGYANGYTLEGNVSFDNADFNIFATAMKFPMERLRVVNNFTWREPEDDRHSIQIGYYPKQRDATILDNYFAGGAGEVLAIKNMSTLNVKGNTIIGVGPLTNWVAGDPGSMVWDNNVYRTSSTNAYKIGEAVKTFSEWQQMTGFDSNSKQIGLPTENYVAVRPNKYEPGRANIIVYNWEDQPSVSVDLRPSRLQMGGSFEIRDAQNFFGPPVLTGTWNGTPIEIPMNLTEVAPIYGNVTHFKNKHTSSMFNVFVLLPVVPR